MSDTVTQTQANQAALGTAVSTPQIATTPRRLREILCLEDFEEPARRLLPRPIFGYIAGGVETNASLAGNRAAFGEFEFLPRVLKGTRGRHQKTTVFGRTYDSPFGFPPMGGTSLAAKIPMGPGYQTPFAERIRREAGVATGTVGFITTPAQADHAIRSGQADCVLIARELLRDPYWPLRAARELGHPIKWPVQYLRSAPAGSPSR